MPKRKKAKVKKKSSRKSNAGTVKLKKIITRAKILRKGSPKTKWTTLVGKAARELKKEKKI